MKMFIFCLVIISQALIGCEWIAVKDQMPPINERIVFWDNTNKIAHCGDLKECVFYKNEVFYLEMLAGYTLEITHWFKLPDDPKLETSVIQSR